MAPDMSSTTTTTPWTQRATLLLPVLLLVCGAAGTASTAVVRGQRTRPAANDEAGAVGALSPLALLVLRAMASDDAAAPAGPAAVLEPVASNDDLAGMVDAAVSSARTSPNRVAAMAAAPDGEFGDTAYLRAAKRQVRYHQCYFNPISCFG